MKENVRVGYQAAIELWIYEGQNNWQRFNAMLVANSILIATIGLSLRDRDPLVIIAAGASFIGIMLCLMWITLTSRGADYHEYWVKSARELEVKLDSSDVRTVDRGAQFASGNVVTFDFDEAENQHRMSWLSRRLRIQTIARGVVLAFLAIYVLMLWQTVTIWSN